MKRQRGRGRKPSNNHNRSFESNGPDVKVRGSASHIYDKYMQLARDATSSGDRVMAEAYFQHAEHYLRVVQASQPRQREDQNNQVGSDDNRGGDNRQHDNRDSDNGGVDTRNSDNRNSDNRSDNRRSDSGADNRDPQDGDGEAAGRNRNRRGRGRRRDDENRDEARQSNAGQSASESGASDPLQVVDLEGDSSSNPSPTPDAPSAEEPPKRRRGRPRKTEAAADPAAEAALKSVESPSEAKSDSGKVKDKSDDAAA